ncbi:MAG: hypothetical protein ACXWIN_05300 [Burkholderiaceae bacterium]
MKVIKTLIFLFSAGLSFTASAQRTPVPILDFKDIPVAVSTNKSLTAEQVGQAIRTAAEYGQWEVTQAGDGVLSAKLRQSQHVIAVAINYEPDKYSVTYLYSLNMKFAPNAARINETVYYGGRGSLVKNPRMDAIENQQVFYKNNPEFQYAVAETAVIHPYYDVWVRNLLNDIRKQLHLAQ